MENMLASNMLNLDSLTTAQNAKSHCRSVRKARVPMPIVTISVIDQIVIVKATLPTNQNQPSISLLRKAFSRFWTTLLKGTSIN